MSDLYNKQKCCIKDTSKSQDTFQMVFMYIIPAISYKSLTKENTFDHYLLMVYAYSKLPKLYGMKNITNEEVMDKLDIFRQDLEK